MLAYLHIGTPKTATTTLQAFFNQNREKLLDDGFIYTASAGELNELNLVVSCCNSDNKSGLTKILGIHSAEDFERLRRNVIENLRTEVNELSANVGRECAVIFSSEYFHLNLTKHQERVRLKSTLESIGITDVRVVVYLRNPADLANSYFSTSVKAGGTSSHPPLPDQERYNLLCNHKNTIQNFQEVFGAGSVVPRLFDKTEFVSGNIIDDFLNLIGSTISTADCEMPKNTNLSLSTEGVIVLSGLNSIFPRWLNNKLNPLQVSAVRYLEKYYSKANYRMPAELYDEYTKAFSESNEWVRQNHFPEKNRLFSEKLSGGSTSSDSHDTSETTIRKIAEIIINDAIDRRSELARSGESLDRIDREDEQDHDDMILSLSMGVAYFNLGDVNNALPLCRNVLKLCPHNRLALVYQSKCYMGMGEYTLATLSIDKAIDAYPDDIELFTIYLQIYSHLKDYCKIEYALLRLQELQPELMGNYIEYADLPKHRGSLKESASRWSELAERFPDNASVQISAANTLFELKEYSQALGFYEKTLLVDSKAKYAMLGSARCMTELGLFEKAEVALVSLQIDFPEFKAGLYEYAKLGGDLYGNAEAANRWKVLSEKYPGDVHTYLQAAVMFSKDKQYDVAIRILERLLEIVPDHERARSLIVSFYYQQANLMFSNDECEGCIEFLVSLLELQPDHAQALALYRRSGFQLVRELFSAGEFGSAVSRLEELLCLDNGNAQVLSFLQRAYYHSAVSNFRSCKYRCAVEELESLVKLNPEHDEGLDLLKKARHRVVASANS